MSFSDALAFAVVMTLRDMNKEKEKRLIKTQKFYQECYEKLPGTAARSLILFQMLFGRLLADMFLLK